MTSYNLPMNQDGSYAEASSGMIEQIGSQGDVAIESLARKKDDLLARLFDRNVKAIHQGNGELIQVELRARREMLKVVKETQLQLLRESCNQYLARGKAASRKETSRFLMEQAEQLVEDGEEICNRFIVTIERKWSSLDSINNQYLRAKVQEQIENEVDHFFSLHSQLVTKFRSIVSEGV